DAAADGVRTKARTNLALLDDLERRRQRTGPERERQVLRLLERPSAQLNPSLPFDPALNHRRPALHLVVEDDGHVIADVPAGFLAEPPPALTIELEVDFRAVGQRIQLRNRIDEMRPGNDRALIERVQQP